MQEETLEVKMVKLCRVQQGFLMVQKVFIPLTLLAGPFGFLVFFVEFFLCLFFGVYLMNKGEFLAGKKYDYVKPRWHWTGRGVAYYAPLDEEAKRCDDTLTLQLLSFPLRCILMLMASFLAYVFMLTVGLRLLRWAIDATGILG